MRLIVEVTEEAIEYIEGVKRGQVFSLYYTPMEKLALMAGGWKSPGNRVVFAKGEFQIFATDSMRDGSIIKIYIEKNFLVILHMNKIMKEKKSFRYNYYKK